MVTLSTPSCIYTRFACLLGYNSNRVPLRVPVLSAPAENERSRRSSFPASLPPLPHPRHLPVPGSDVISAFPLFTPAIEHIMARGALEEYWLVVTHRDEVVSEEGLKVCGGDCCCCWLPQVPYIFVAKFCGSGTDYAKPLTMAAQRNDLM